MAETEIKVSPATIVAEETPALPNNTKNFFDLVWEANKLGLEGKRLVHISAGADFETGCQIYRLIHEDDGGELKSVACENARLREALRPLVVRMQAMLTEDCDCEADGHVCGRPQAIREVEAAIAALPAAPAGSKPANTSAGGRAVPVLGGASLCPLCHSRRGESLVCQCCGNLLEGDKGVDDGTPIS